MPESRRGSILIEPYKQLRFGIVFLLNNLFFSLLALGVFSYFLIDIYTALSVYFKLDSEESLVSGLKLAKPLLVVFALVVLFIVSTLFLSVRYTHQIYGPLISIHRFLDELLAGKKPAAIQLRSSDQLQSLVFRLNELGSREQLVSLESLLGYLDKVLKGEKAEVPRLAAGDPLEPLAEKLLSLQKKIKSD